MFDVPLGNNLVAAVKDIVMEGFVKLQCRYRGDVCYAGRRIFTKTLNHDTLMNIFRQGLLFLISNKMVEENTLLN
ncbi:hypothetical protein MJ579_19425 [Klebsiella pneumoniae]|nr:hypothetical protein MJ579_19425 [Klebsiella pneumoniae]